jgi:hypothetical protein
MGNIDIEYMVREDTLKRSLYELENNRERLITMFLSRSDMQGKTSNQIYQEMVESVHVEPFSFLIHLTKMKQEGKLEKAAT